MCPLGIGDWGLEFKGGETVGFHGTGAVGADFEALREEAFRPGRGLQGARRERGEPTQPLEESLAAVRAWSPDSFAVTGDLAEEGAAAKLFGGMRGFARGSPARFSRPRRPP